MPAVSVTRSIAAPVAVAEALWYDTSRWAEWVDGLEQVTAAAPGWPAAGAAVSWRSGPAGRGLVTERVLRHASGRGQTSAVSDDAIEGEQSIAFAPAPGGVQLTLRLGWRRRRPGPVSALVDLLFSRRAMTDSLAHTLERFAIALGA